MKQIGTTSEYNILVEMTEQEWQALTRLDAAFGGKGFEMPIAEPHTITSPLENPLTAVRAFSVSLESINDLDHLIQEVKEKLKQQT